MNHVETHELDPDRVADGVLIIKSGMSNEFGRVLLITREEDGKVLFVVPMEFVPTLIPILEDFRDRVWVEDN